MKYGFVMVLMFFSLLPIQMVFADDDVWTSDSYRIKGDFCRLPLNPGEPPLDRGPYIPLHIVDKFGNGLAGALQGQTLSFMYDLLFRENPSTFVLQIFNSAGQVVHLDWIEATYPSNPVILNWQTNISDTYTVQAFQWTTIENPIAICPIYQKTLKVI